MKILDRRRFLLELVRALAASGVVLSLPLAACGETPRRSDSGAGGLLHDLDAAIQLGRRYLKKHPDPEPLEALGREVFGDDTRSIEMKTRLIAARIENDFKTDDVVAIRGWRLARTEAVLCALIAREDDMA